MHVGSELVPTAACKKEAIRIFRKKIVWHYRKKCFPSFARVYFLLFVIKYQEHLLTTSDKGNQLNYVTVPPLVKKFNEFCPSC